jgi:phage terminase large subunit GpA-like protein
MKGCQLGITAGAENVVAYWMDENPAPILFMSATDDLLEEWTALRLEFVIDSCGYRDKIVAQSSNRKSRRSGDKTSLKEFVGGFLAMCSAQSPGKQRSKSVRILIRDEIDGAPAQLRTGEGNWIAVSEGRTDAWGVRKKIFDISTPTLFGSSAIDDQYQAGDQRKFMVPCPHCGKKQPLELGSEDTQHGLKAERKAGQLIDAYYLCDHCHDAIFNHHKTRMLAAGEWAPTTQSTSPVKRSYHLPSFYSPVGMLSWLEMWRKYETAQRTPDGMRSFTNLYLGLPFKETGTRPKLESVIELRGGYPSGTVSDGVIYLVCGIDVQQGSRTDKQNPPRLELEVMGIGLGYRTWSVLYKRIEGEVEDPYAGAWQKLHEWVMGGGLTFKRKDGVEFQTRLIFIDSGDGNLTSVVYAFSQGWQNTYPSKGFQALKKQKGEKKDEIAPSNFKRYRAVKVNEDLFLYEISTNYYKSHIYRNLKIERQPGEAQRAGFCDFPVDYGEKYFKMLTAEEKRTDGAFHCPSGRRNEALDCRGMCMCAADVFLDSKLMEFKAAAKNAGATEPDIAKINHRFVLELMERQIT